MQVGVSPCGFRIEVNSVLKTFSQSFDICAWQIELTFFRVIRLAVIEVERGPVLVCNILLELPGQVRQHTHAAGNCVELHQLGLISRLIDHVVGSQDAHVDVLALGLVLELLAD